MPWRNGDGGPIQHEAQHESAVLAQEQTLMPKLGRQHELVLPKLGGFQPGEELAQGFWIKGPLPSLS